MNETTQTIIHVLKGGNFYYNSKEDRMIPFTKYDDIPFIDIHTVFTDVCDCYKTGNGYYCNGHIKFEFTYKYN